MKHLFVSVYLFCVVSTLPIAMHTHNVLNQPLNDGLMFQSAIFTLQSFTSNALVCSGEWVSSWILIYLAPPLECS